VVLVVVRVVLAFPQLVRQELPTKVMLVETLVIQEAIKLLVVGVELVL
jgi:hypothetical protein